MITNITRLLAWLASYTCFWCGDIISKLVHFDCFFGLYPAYNTLMRWSCTLSDKYNLGIWLDTPIVDIQEYDND